MPWRRGALIRRSFGDSEAGTAERSAGCYVCFEVRASVVRICLRKSVGYGMLLCNFAKPECFSMNEAGTLGSFLEAPASLPLRV